MIYNYAYTVVRKFEIFHVNVFLFSYVHYVYLSLILGDLKIFVFHLNYAFCFSMGTIRQIPLVNRDPVTQWNWNCAGFPLDLENLENLEK